MAQENKGAEAQAEVRKSTNAEKYPDLWMAFQKLQNERSALLEANSPLTKRREELQSKIAPLEAEMRAVNKQIKEQLQPRLFEIDNQISALARAMGGKSVKHEDGQ